MKRFLVGSVVLISFLVGSPASSDERDCIRELLKSSKPSVQRDAEAWSPLFGFKEWSSASGEFKLRARFAGFDFDIVVLRRQNGTDVRVPIAKLSNADQKVLRQVVAARMQMREHLLAELKTSREQIRLVNEKLASTTKHTEAIQEELTKYKPRNKLAAADGIPIVTAKQIKVTGERCVGKEVRLLDCKFMKVDNVWVQLTLKKKEELVGFMFDDSEGTYFPRAVASKKQYVDFLLSLKRGARFNVSGVIVEVSDDYFLFVKTIELKK